MGARITWVSRTGDTFVVKSPAMHPHEPTRRRLGPVAAAGTLQSPRGHRIPPNWWCRRLLPTLRAGEGGGSLRGNRRVGNESRESERREMEYRAVDGAKRQYEREGAGLRRRWANARATQTKLGRGRCEPPASTAIGCWRQGVMPSDPVQNICALEPGLKRSDNVPPRRHSSRIETDVCFDAACIDAIQAGAVRPAVDSTDVFSTAVDSTGESFADVSLTDSDVLDGCDVVDAPCDIEER